MKWNIERRLLFVAYLQINITFALNKPLYDKQINKTDCLGFKIGSTSPFPTTNKTSCM